MTAFGWLRGGDDAALAKSNYEGRESATDRAARLRMANHRIRVNRDGDAAGTEPRRRLFGRN
ncbi:hypothetical protein [Streptomyces sp. NE06-03C]|uniref:hypothetical protein n=1 Tax=Streptomyces sp. NE06-03C TaxID=3028694 RepID=UPI0029BEE380|nr:hypothetical protein [Streptomyces sp. NE06-03C]MDX2922778.1 hypothetical protein [Streptomyces sp. NE06-03C]